MSGIILALHVLISLSLIIVVLLQSGKGGGLAGAFGGGGGVGAMFGGQAAATFLTKATRYLAVAFMLTSLTLAFFVRHRSEGTIAGTLERRGPMPATEAGEVLPSGEIPEGLPETPGAGTEEQPEPPVAPEGD